MPTEKDKRNPLTTGPHEPELEAALSAADPETALRQLALRLARDQGLKKQEVYGVFHAFSLKLAHAGRDEEAARVQDVMDMITGWYVGQNLDLPGDD